MRNTVARNSIDITPSSDWVGVCGSVGERCVGGG